MTDQANHTLAPPPCDLLQGASLFLDFDGTLVGLTTRPQDVTVDEGLYRLLAELRDKLDGRLAFVSGRSVAVLRGAFGLGDFLLSGSHGLEIAIPGQAPQAPARPPEIDTAQQELIRFVAGKAGLLVEEKTLGVALHYRLAPELEEQCRAICEDLARQTGLYLQHGKMLFELRPGQAGKGTAVAHLLAETELQAGRPVFIGDDITDEDGFRAAADHDGSGILVGEARDTAAYYRLENVQAVHRWLAKCTAHLRKGD